MAAFPTYRTREGFPAEQPDIRVVFHGLLMFCFDGSRQCEVGIHNATHSDPPQRRHLLEVNLWTKRGNACPRLPARLFAGDSRDLQNIEMRVDFPPDDMDGVFAFTAAGGKETDKRDFRWVPDLEGDSFYNAVLPKRLDLLRPSLRINNGLFHTIYKTNSTFKKVGGQGAPGVGNIGTVVGANIYLSDDSQFTLQLDSLLVPLLREPGVTYQIDFTNTCECLAVEEQNDFNLYRDAFEIPPAKSEIKLALDVETPGDDVIDICFLTSGPHESDRAPCGPAACGRSSSLSLRM
jgi:hypothetical protein